MRVIERIAEFLGFISDRLLEVVHQQRLTRRENAAMAATLQVLMDKLTAQGTQIDQLVASRDAQEQTDLDKINALIDANGSKFAAALAPAPAVTTGQTLPDPSATVTQTVSETVPVPVQDATSLAGQLQTTG